MKRLSLFTLVLTAIFVHADADTDIFRPVINEVVFAGDYVTFGEAKPTFRPTHQEQPVYPVELLERRIEGFAVVAFLVELDGTTSQCQVAKASDVAFGEAAREAIAKWRFSAPEFAGRRGPIAMRLPVDFTLDPGLVENASESKAVASR